MNSKPPWNPSANKTTPLDNLMMSYADLSGGKKGPGGASAFKGPALKDVKIEKSLAPEYKPSQKSRDWSTLSQNLEDAFVISSPSSAVPALHQNIMNVSFQQQNPIIPTQPVIQQTREEPKDEWGDFQDFGQTNVNVQNQHQSFSKPATSLGNFGTSPCTFNQPYVSQQQSLPTLSQPMPSFNNAEDDDDDFADFVAAAPNTIKPPSLSSTSIPTVEFAFPSQNIIPTRSSNPPQVSSITQKSNEIPSSNSIGSRLATFQEESPIHRFKATIPDTDKNEVTKDIVDADDDDDFGDFATSRNVMTSSNKNTFSSMNTFASPVVNTILNPFEGSTKPESLLTDNNFATTFTSMPALQPTQNSDDKYSAFRNAFGGEGSSTAAETKETSVESKTLDAQEVRNDPYESSIGTFSKETIPIIPSSNEVKLQPNLSFSMPVPSSPTSNNQLHLASLNLSTSQSVTNQMEEDDFGDFIAVRNDEKNKLPEPSKGLSDLESMHSIAPTPSEKKHVRSDTFFMPQQTGVGGGLNSSAIMPVWHDSEPPPLMDDNSNSPGLNTGKEDGSGGLNDDFFQGFDDHDVISMSDNNDGIGCTSILDEEQYFEASSNNKTPSENENSSDKQSPEKLDILAMPRNASASSLNLRLGSSSPEEETNHQRNELEISKDGISQIPPKSFNCHLNSTNSINEPGLSNGIDIHNSICSSPLSTWLAALQQIHTLISQATDSFIYIPNELVLEEVIQSEEGSNYIKNIVEIYRVYKRIKVSHQKYINSSVTTEDKSNRNEENIKVNQIQDRIEQAWKQLIINLNGKSIIPEKELLNFSEEISKELENSKFHRTVDNSCGICLLSTSSHHQFSKPNLGQNGKLFDAILKHGNQIYHSTCANFWVNRVELVLPTLNETK